MKKTKTVNKPVSLLWILVLCMLAISPGYAQDGTAKRKISGKVTGKLGEEPVVSASVTIKGTSQSVSTNGQGEFAIEAKTGDVLEVSSVGYATKAVKVGSSAVVEIRLDKDYNDLQDVVVVGYGRMKKTDLSSSQVTVTSTDISRTVNTSLEQGLQGRAANVYVTSNSGQPGAPASVLIRGINSLSYSTQPLYVVDGVQMRIGNAGGGDNTGTNLLSTINPDDIETMNVLQGPAATSIYGSAGGNGVVMITTKRGKSGETKVNFNTLVSIQDVPDRIPVMNLREYATYRNEFAKSGGAAFEPTFADPSVLGEGSDWQAALFRRTLLQKYSLGLSGGNDRTTFYTGAEYFKQEGVARGSGFERYSVRLNLDNQTRRWLRIGTNLSVSQVREQVNTSNGDLLNLAISQNPSVPVTNPDGSWGGPVSTQFQFSNPVALASINNNRNKAMAFTGGLYADITLLKGLVFHNEVNGYFQYKNKYIFKPSYKFNGLENAITESSRTAENDYWWGLQQRLQYDFRINKHVFTAMAGHESNENGWEGLEGMRRNFVSNAVQELSGGDALTATNNSSKGSVARESFFGRLNYVYDDKYILQFVIRRDGASSFGEANRWGNFPAVSAAWRVSKEKFLQSVDAINDLKLRVEYGASGNSSADGYWAALYSVPTASGTGYLSQNFSNPFMKWENSVTTNLGFDLRMFNNRLEIIGDFYIKKVDDLLTINDYPFYSGGDMSYSSGYIRFPTTNVGSMRNKGFGITINSVNVESPFTWKTGANFSVDRNEILSFYQNSPINSTYKTSSLITSSRIGQPAALFTGYYAEGLFQNIDEIKNHANQLSGAKLISPTQGTWVGDVKFKDVDGPNKDGKPDGIVDQNDRVVIGNPWPKFTFGLTNTFSYKNFDLSVLIIGVQGNDIFNYTRYINENPQGTGVFSNYFRSVADFARPSSVDANDASTKLNNPGYQIPRITTNTANGNFRANQWYIEDGSYVRIKNVTLSYIVPARWSSKAAMKFLKVSAGVQNLATFTKYKGYDPEVGMRPVNGSLAVGVDDARYPSTRMYSFSLTAEF
ncbi:SusC/RagA family TonB-linked outer membrane protein [Paraflavitalea pollutisoli]|uniref:SusC/RagA family TonB-linked outer membrane protein n=1 Tax=Paraflavitalea pollutisoli TaxID=3034143 RepID=UPI0023EBBCCF|nr:TonB-dependent receptor [Paraflavitalea sp. H1-2-19X]